MARFESITQLYNVLKQARYPLTNKHLQDKLGRSEASIERYISELRNTYSLKIIYDREYNGYQLKGDHDDIELPSHLFTTQEINALLLIEQIINDLEPGFLEEDTKAVKQHLANIRKKFSGDNKIQSKRIRMINIGKRQGNIKHLSQVTQAVLQGKKVIINYQSRTGKLDKKTNRILSPLRLTHYRDNWYLDAWCHQYKALRTFALERINKLHLQKEAGKIISHNILDKYYMPTFGIFGGAINDTAILKFTPHRAQWVAEETWHPQQKGTWLKDGSYQLEIPYGNDIELISDILKYGDQVEVIAPQELREKIITRVEKIIKIYK